MAAIIHGTAYIFGVTSGTVTDAVVLAFNKTKGFGLTGETKNETGVTVERRYDDKKTDATMTLRIKAGYTIPTQGATLSHDSTTYEILTVAESESNTDYKAVDLTLMESEGVTYS